MADPGTEVTGAPAPKVVHIITGLNNGGAEGTLSRLCRHPDSPPSLIISLTGLGYHGQGLRDAGIPVETLEMPRGRVTLRGLVRLWRILRQTRPMVVQTWMYHADFLGGLTARLAGVPRIVWGIRSTRLAKKESAWVFAQLCARISAWVPQAIICCAQSARAEHVRIGYAESRIVVVANGFDCDYLAPDRALGLAFRHSLGLSPQQPVIGMVARFDPQKDHANLLAALCHLAEAGRPFTCLLAGPGMEADNPDLAAMLAETGMNAQVRLLGALADVRAVMNAIDLHVLSSRSEGFPNVIAEAMACGCPCVATDVGAAAEIIGDTGWLAPPGNSAKLAAAIEQALDGLPGDGWSLRQLAARDRVVSRFGLAKMVTEFKSVWF